MGRAARGPGRGVGQAGPDVGALEPVGLVGVAPAEGGGDVGQRDGVGDQACAPAPAIPPRCGSTPTAPRPDPRPPPSAGRTARSRCWASTASVTSGVTKGCRPGRRRPTCRSGSGRADSGSSAPAVAGQTPARSSRMAGTTSPARRSRYHSTAAGLVDRARLLEADLVGQPQQLDRLGQPAAPPRPFRRLQRYRPDRRRWARIDWRADSVGWAVRTGRTSMRAEQRRSAPPAPMPGVAEIPDYLRQPGRAGPQANSSARCTCSAMLAAWK